jgi:small multidrug resistance pump
MNWLILLLGIAANAAASVLIKVAVTPPRHFPPLDRPWEAWTNWPLVLGLALYGAAFVLYAAALARLPLNVAHPILTSGAVASVALLSFVVFREAFPWTTIAGLVFVLIGVSLIGMSVR